MKKVICFFICLDMAISLFSHNSYSQISGVPQNSVTSIYDIQFTSESSGNSPYTGQVVTINGIITGVFFDGYCVAEDRGAWHSIFVYSKLNGPSINDHVQLTGKVNEYNGLTEIIDVSAYKTLLPDKRIEPCLVSAAKAATEPYESVLVRIANADVVSFSPEGEWTISDYSGGIRCGNKNDYVYFPQIKDRIISIEGIVLYDKMLFKLEPRFTTDIQWSKMPHYALYGDVVTMNGGLDLLKNTYVEIWGDEIRSVTNVSPRGVVCYKIDGFIFPGLIDSHNHPQWDVLNKIPFNETFAERYEWQQTDIYKHVQEQFNSILNYGGTDAQLINLFKLEEVKAMCSGTSTIEGINCNDPQYDGFAHQGIGINNAERFPARIYSDVFPLTRGLTFWQNKSHEYWKRFVIHLAEGSDQAALQEFYAWKNMNMLDNRTTIIHGIPLGKDEFINMSQAGANLIWSPGSNCYLYKKTANIPSAIAAGVNVALAPDWTESGMPDLLSELKFARHLADSLWRGYLTDRQLVEFVTRNAAKALGLEDRIGSVAPGMEADLMVIPKKSSNPYTSLINTKPSDILLTIVDGRPMYGEPGLIDRFNFVKSKENIVVCGKKKKIALQIYSQNIDQSDRSFSEIIGQLKDAYLASGPKICKFLPDNCNSLITRDKYYYDDNPDKWILYPNYPNPVHNVTTISYFLPFDSKVRLSIYNNAGQLACILVDDFETQGFNSIEWHADGFKNGIYYCVLEVEDLSNVRQVIKIEVVK